MANDQVEDGMGFAGLVEMPGEKKAKDFAKQGLKDRIRKLDDEMFKDIMQFVMEESIIRGIATL